MAIQKKGGHQESMTILQRRQKAWDLGAGGKTSERYSPNGRYAKRPGSQRKGRTGKSQRRMALSA